MLILQKSVLLLFAIILCSCAAQLPTDSNSGNPPKIENTQAAKDDLAELNSIIRLPYVPEDVVWREETNKENHKKLVAVMRFSPDDEKSLIEKAKSYREPEATETTAEDWFPPELIAQTELYGDETLKGISYSAKDFIQMPYKTGRLIKILNSNYFVLELLQE